MKKRRCGLSGFLLLGFLIITTCSLEGDIEAQRQKPIPVTIPAPGAPVVTASDRMITIHWTAVDEAERYEVFVGTVLEPPGSPIKTISAPTTTTIVDNLVNKTTYYIWIKAVNRSGSSDFSPRGRGIPWPPNEIPATPERPTIIPGINLLTVNWDECGGAASYEVYKNTAPSTPPTTSTPEITTDKTSAVIKNLENNVIYYIWVRAVNSAGKSAYSPVESGIPKVPAIAPAVPARPVLTAGNRELAVSWQAVELAAAYEIWLGTSDNSGMAVKQGGDITGGITETIITGLQNETVYYVWIKAKNVIGTSGFSPSATTKPTAFAVVPQVPATPAVTAGNSELRVSWQPVEGALSYEVWTGLSNNPANAEKYGADVSSTSVTLTGLVNGTTYYLWVKAKNNIGVSGLSPQASGKPLGTPGVPTVSSDHKQLLVTWTAVPGADEYEVYYGIGTPTTLATTTTGTTTTITGLTNGTTYYVRLRTKNTKGVSDYGPSASGMPERRPGLYKGDNKIGNQDLADSLTYISANAENGDNFYIILGADEISSPRTLNYSGKTVAITLLGYDYERTITLSANGSLFTSNSGVTLILGENIRLDGRGSNTASLVSVQTGGSLIMNDKAKITNNTSSSYGGGVYVNSGTFTMSGGTISGNTASSYGGGVYVNSSGTFTMNGGEISGNTASSLYGGGVYVRSGIFTMSGGTISGNTASSGGGVCIDSNGTFTMSGGTISGNTASSLYGGGVYVKDGTFTMSGGTISGNTASFYGGGVYVNIGGTFTMRGGTISGNTASSYGGGVYVDSSGTFTKTGGGTITGYASDTINGNVVKNSGVVQSSRGHVVYVNSSPVKRRETTAGQEVNLDSSKSGVAGGWE